MGNASLTPTMIENKKDRKAIKRGPSNYQSKHRMTFQVPKDTKQLRNQYFNKLSEVREIEKHSLRNNNSFLKEYSDTADISISSSLRTNNPLRNLKQENNNEIMIIDEFDIIETYQSPKKVSFKIDQHNEYENKTSEFHSNLANSFTLSDEDNETEVSSKTPSSPIDLTKRRKLLKNNEVQTHSNTTRSYISDNQSYISDIKSKPETEYEFRYPKSAELIRSSYIAKLIYKGIWSNKEEKNHNNLIIFDWDDTLLCTSFLTPNGLFNDKMKLSDKDKEKIYKLEFAVLRLLTLAINKGKTYIVTNAAPGWVEYSCKKFYPSVTKLLNKITIVSARGEFESIYPGDSRMWKIEAFLRMQKNMDTRLITNMICLGDSFIEMEAAHMLASKFSQAFVKTVKFRENPQAEELNKQLLLVGDQFDALYSVVKNMTIKVEKKR